MLYQPTTYTRRLTVLKDMPPKNGGGMQARPPDQAMIALCSFTTGIGMVRMWSHYTEDGRKVRQRLHQQQAMEDVTVIDGLTLDHAKRLGRSSILTLEHLKVIEIDRLQAAGLDQEAVDLILAWRAEEGVESVESSEPEGLAVIEGLTPTNAKKLTAAGLDTLDKLLVAPVEALEELKLSKSALEAVKAWREQQAKAETAEKRETKA